MYFEDYPAHIIKDVNIKSAGNTGLVLNTGQLEPQERVEDFSFKLLKTLRNEEMAEEVTNYLDTRMCLARSNKQSTGPNGACQAYVFRKIKIGTWAKTSLREEARFVLSCTVSTSLGRSFEVFSPSFEIFSHQSQLPTRRAERRGDFKPVFKRQRTPPLTIVPALSAPADIFALQSLSDACLKVTAADDLAVCTDSASKRMRLVERADDLHVRIEALRQEEQQLREMAQQLAAAEGSDDAGQTTSL